MIFFFYSYVSYVDQREKNDLVLSENENGGMFEPQRSPKTQFETDEPLDFQGPQMRHHSKIQQGVGSCIF